MKYSKKQIDNFKIDEDYFQPIVELYFLSVNLYKGLFSSKGFDITAQQWHALNRLWQEDGLQQADLANKIYKDYSFTTRLVDDLEKKKLVFRERDPEDRRANRVFLTAKGQECKYDLIQIYLEMSEKLLKNVTAEELGKFAQTSKKLKKNYTID